MEFQPTVATLREKNHRKLGIYPELTLGPHFDSPPKCAKFSLQSPQVVNFCMLLLLIYRAIIISYRGLICSVPIPLEQKLNSQTQVCFF